MYKKWWKTIVKLMVIAMFFTTIFSMLGPVNYVSTVTIISAGSGGSSSSSIGKLLGISGLGGGDSSNEIIIAILRSNRMARDIQAFLQFNKKQKFSYAIATREIAAGMAINVRGNDPLFTEKIANFAVQNLDKINSELNITPSKPMVKVLDSATYGARESRQTPRKILIAGLAAFLLMSLYIFFSDYLRKLKTQQ